MRLSILNDKDLCKALEVFEACDKFKYDEKKLRVSTLENGLEEFGDAFNRWLIGLSVDNVMMVTPFARLSVIAEMSERFKKMFA